MKLRGSSSINLNRGPSVFLKRLMGKFEELTYQDIVGESGAEHRESRPHERVASNRIRKFLHPCDFWRKALCRWKRHVCRRTKSAVSELASRTESCSDLKS